MLQYHARQDVRCATLGGEGRVVSSRCSLVLEQEKLIRDVLRFSTRVLSEYDRAKDIVKPPESIQNN